LDEVIKIPGQRPCFTLLAQVTDFRQSGGGLTKK